ncbi:MAG: tetratricopeptide repeat protein [Bacteroidota bacterium]
MKSFWLTLTCILFASHTLLAQNNILRGIITYQNTGTPVSGVQITPTIANASPVYTNDAGIFEIEVAGGEPGDPVTLVVQKTDHQVIGSPNPILVDAAIRKNKDDLVTIVVVKTSELSSRQDKYVAAIEKQLKEKEESIKFLRSQLRNNQISDDERTNLSKEIAERSAQIAELEKSKNELAKKLAETDLSKAADFVVKAIQKFEKEGDAEAALEILEEEKLEKLYQDGVTQEKAAAKAKAQAVEGYMTRARLQITQLAYKAAYKNYLEAIEKDSTNLDNLWEVAYFLGEQNQTKRAIRLFKQALQHAKNEATQSHFLNNLGNYYKDLNEYDKAETAYLNALKIRERLVKNNSERFELDLAITHNNLGVLYSVLNQYAKAEAAYLNALKIRERLAKNNPERSETNAADIQNNLGIFYQSSKQYAKAEAAYLNALKIREILAKDNPNRFEPDLAATQNNLGIFYKDLNQYKKAEAAHLNALKIRERLAKDNPNRFEPDLAITYNNLGEYYRVLSQYDKAEAAYLNALKIRERLAKGNPKRFEPDLAVTYNNLGIFYQASNQCAEAEAAHLKALKIRKQLVKNNPERFEPDLAITQNNLGIFYQDSNQHDKADSILICSLKIYKNLAIKNPQKYELEVARTLGIKAQSQIALKNLEIAKEHLLEAKALAEKYPQVPVAQTFLYIIQKGLDKITIPKGGN